MIYIHQTAYFFLLGAEMNQVIEAHIPGSDSRRDDAEKGVLPAPRQPALPAANPPADGDSIRRDAGSRAEAELGRKVLAAGAALGLAGVFFRWVRRGRR
jgi:hypothetical protein